MSPRSIIMEEEETYLDIALVYDENNPENNIIDQDLILFLQEIELAVKLGPNDIWGINESINLNRYLFNRFVTVTQIRNEMITYIQKHCQHSQNFQFTLSVEMLNIENKDLVYITMKIIAPDQNNEDKEFIKKFLLGN